MTVWCGGEDEGQDVTVRLVASGISINGSVEDGEPLLLLKLHSNRLSKCSKYFETCLSERWQKPSASSTIEFSLEVIHADVSCYTDCFECMYSSYRKDFRDVSYSLALLKVASQIGYHELMDAVSRYLSGIPWSEQEEIRIREYSTSPDFPRNFTDDLVSRLGFHVVEEECQEKMCEMIRRSTWSALGCWQPQNFRDFIEELLDGIQLGTKFMETVVPIIIEVAKDRFVELENDCLEADRFSRVANFAEHVSGMCWILNLLLNTNVAEELVQCLLHLNTIPDYLTTANSYDVEDVGLAGLEMAKLVLRMYKEVAAGRLLLRTAERVALVKNWHELLEAYLPKEDYDDATKPLFATLPLEEQIEHVNLQEDSYVDFIDARSLATLMKKNWSALDGRTWRPPVLEGMQSRKEMSSSDGVGDEGSSRPAGKAKRRKPRRKQAPPPCA